MSEQGLSKPKFEMNLCGVTHSYGENEVLVDVSLKLCGGQMIGVYGPNGAGKSTLLKIVAGILRPTFGEISIDGQSLRLASPRAARKAGVRYISQELSLVPAWTVERQLKHEFGGASFEGATTALQTFGFKPDLSHKIELLTSEQKQILEVAKSLVPAAKVILFDEPTSGLDSGQRDIMYKKLRELAAEGKLVIIVSHDLQRLSGSCDYFLKTEGRTVVRTEEIETSANVAIAHSSAETREGLKQVLGVSIRAFETFRFQRRRITGVTGTLRTEVDRLLRKIYDLGADGISILETDNSDLNSEPGITHVRYVSSDRNKEWGFAEKPMWENISIRLAAGDHIGMRNIRSEKLESLRIMQNADVRPLALEKPFGEFSGGNRQKAIVASEIDRSPDLLLLDEPLSGIDADARRWLAVSLVDFTSQGGTVILYSQEYDDLAKLSDELVVLDELGGNHDEI